MMPCLNSDRFKKTSMKTSSDITADEDLYLICGEKYKGGNSKY